MGTRRPESLGQTGATPVSFLLVHRIIRRQVWQKSHEGNLATVTPSALGLSMSSATGGP
jgi:hypothetical protein